MKKLVFAFTALLIGLTQAQAQNPYAALGIEEQVLHYDDTHKEVFDQDSIKPIGYAMYNPTLGLLGIFDLKDSLVAVQKIDPGKVARFLSVDPKAEKYYGWSPYNFVLGNPIRNIDHRGDTVKILGGDGVSLNWTPGMSYGGKDVFTNQTVGALNLLYQNRTAGDISLMKGKITGNVFDFTGDANHNVSIRNMWNTDGTAYNALAAKISIGYTNEAGTEILFDPFTGVHIGDLSPDMTKDPANAYHTPGNLSPAVILGHELGHAWLTQYAPELKRRLRASSNDVEHANLIHGKNGVETRFGLAIDGAARVFRTPYNSINPEPLVPGTPSIKYYDYLITTKGATSNVSILNKYNH